MNKIIFYSLIFYFSSSLLLSVSAQTSTDSASTLRDSVKQKVDEELSQIKKAVSKKAYLGLIKEKNEATLTLTNYQNQPRTVIVSTDANVIQKSGKDGTLADLKTDGYILAMGDVDSTGVMTAKRVLIITPPASEKRRHLSGVVKSVSATSLTLTAANSEIITARISSSLTSVNPGKISGLKTGQTVVTILKPATSAYFSDIYIVSTAPASPSSTPTP